MRTALPLKAGDAVGIAAPSGAFDRKAFEAGIALLERWQLRPIYHRDIFSRYRYFAGSHRRRLRELQELLDRRDIRGVLFARGGFGLHHILPQLRLTQLKRYPKRIIGYSDLTMLLERIRGEVGLVSYYGPSLCDLGRSRSHTLKHAYLSTLLGTERTKVWRFRSSGVVRHGRAEGYLAGGCLTLLNASLGTSFEIKTRGSLLLIEDVNESMYRIERMLLQLQQAGKLHGVRGIIISVLTCKEAPVSARQWQMMLKDVLTGFRGPIVYGFRFGHMDNPYLLPIGRRAMLNTRRAELRLLPT